VVSQFYLLVPETRESNGGYPLFVSGHFYFGSIMKG